MTRKKLPQVVMLERVSLTLSPFAVHLSLGEAILVGMVLSNPDYLTVASWDSRLTLARTVCITQVRSAFGTYR